MPTPIYEPDFEFFQWSDHDPFNPRRSDEQTDRAVRKLYEAFLQIASDPELKDEEYREMWVVLERGKPDDWCTYEEYCEEASWDSDVTPTEERWLDEWKGYFPEENYWHLLRCNRYQDWITVRLDDVIVIQTSPDEKAPYHDDRVDRFLLGLADKVEQAVAMMRTGEYARWVRKSLPFDRRYGLIQRKTLWDATEGAFDECWRIDAEEAKLLADALRAQPSESEIGRLPSLTTGKYFEALKVGYRATGRKNERDWPFGDIPAEDGRAWYARFGDERDHTLPDIDPQSEDEFESWYEGKLRRFGFDHNFEIFLGRGCSRVHMNPHKDEQGWYCSMWGSITWHASDMARVWKAVNDAGVPVFVGDAEALADALEGEDWILIVPRHLSCDYVRGMYFGREVRTAIPLLEDHRDAIVKAAEWKEPKLPQLAEATRNHEGHKETEAS